MLRECAEGSTFYRAKAADAGLDLLRLPPRDLCRLPCTTKEELVSDQAAHPPFGTVPSLPSHCYTRVHRTSGTTGRPLRWLDTEESWDWWRRCWLQVYQSAGVTAADRVFTAFSFGPFVGFWAGFEAAQELGALAIPGGGLTTEQRLKAMLELEVTVLVCTPTYALRLAEAARTLGLDLAACPVRRTIHAGEPGASLPSVRARIESAWGARCTDHAGATEVGAWGAGCPDGEGLHLLEEEFLAEVLEPARDAPARLDADGVQEGELVLTNLGRLGAPILRYRTGDRVRLRRGGCLCGSAAAALLGGVLGRADDMFVVRGVNVFPSAIENLVRGFEAITEFDACVRRRAEMAELELRVEVDSSCKEADARSACAALARRLHDRLHLRARVRLVGSGTLPRTDLKARRFRFEAS